MKRSFASIIVRVSVWQIALIMSALIVATPNRAYASDGFLGGLQDLVGTREVEDVQDYESDYLDDYNPQLRADPPDPGTNTLTDLGEDATTVDYVNVTLDSFNQSGWRGTADTSLLGGLRLFFAQKVGNSGMAVILTGTAAGLVFMWWGVRKCIQIVMSGFRKGSISI